MKALLISLAALLILPLSGCRESPALVKMDPMDLSLHGYWYEAEPGEDNCVMWAEITSEETTVYMRSEDGTDYLCWSGTYTEPVGRPDRYSWVSWNGEIKNHSAAYDDKNVKVFEYYDGEITFTRNVDSDVVLVPVPAGDLT